MQASHYYCHDCCCCHRCCHRCCRFQLNAWRKPLRKSRASGGTTAPLWPRVMPMRGRGRLNCCWCCCHFPPHLRKTTTTMPKYRASPPLSLGISHRRASSLPVREGKNTVCHLVNYGAFNSTSRLSLSISTCMCSCSLSTRKEGPVAHPKRKPAESTLEKESNLSTRPSSSNDRNEGDQCSLYYTTQK